MLNKRLIKLWEMQKENPEDTFLKYAIAMEFLGMNDIVSAKKYFEEVIAVDENNVAAYYQIGKIYETNNEATNAISIYEKGLEAAIKKNDLRSVREINTAIESLKF